MMTFKELDLWVGVFVVIGMAALLFLSLKVANLTSFSAAEAYTVKAEFDNIGGLKVRAPVKSAGVVVGRVNDIRFDECRQPFSVPQGQFGQHPHFRLAGRAIRRADGRR